MAKIGNSKASEIRLGSLSAVTSSVSEQLKNLIDEHHSFEYQESETLSVLEMLEQADVLYKRTLLLALLSRATFEEIEKATGIPVLKLAEFFRQVQDGMNIHKVYNHNFKLGG